MSKTYGTVPYIKLPTTITELKDYIKRKLGYPVVQINVTDEQFYDRIAEALLYYRDWHYDGTIRTYVKWQLTQEDIDNQYLIFPDPIIGVVRIFDPKTSERSKFSSIQYRLMAEINFATVFGYSMQSFQEYYLTRQRLADMDQLFRSAKGFRFNINSSDPDTHKQQLFIEMDWINDVSVGDFIIAEVQAILDPQVYTSIFSDRWLLEYATAKVKMQWGQNIKKFGGIPLAGGLSMDGQGMYDEGKEEKEALEKWLQDSSMPPMDLIG